MSLTEKSPLGVICIALNGVLLGLAAFSLAVRLASRHIQRARLCFNDYAAILTLPFAVGLYTVGVLAVVYGKAGQHIVDVPPENVTIALKTIIPATMLWAASNASFRLSILHFYNTIFGLNNRFRLLTYATMVLVVLFAIGGILQAFLLCRPFAKNWNPSLPGTCGDTIHAFLGDAIINVIVDFSIITLPMPMVWNLQMPPRRKIALTVVFGLGIIVCVITVLRIDIVLSSDHHDFTHGLAKIAIVTNSEPLLGLIIACLPMFPPATKRMMHGKLERRDPITSSYIARLLTKKTKHSAFRKFDDLYPLTDLYESQTENQITAADNAAHSVHDGKTAGLGAPGDTSYKIRIERDWEVRSDAVA